MTIPVTLLPDQADAVGTSVVVKPLAERFTRTGVGRDWLHAYARNRIARFSLIAQSVVVAACTALLAVGFGYSEPRVGRAVVVAIVGAIHTVSCWIAWHYGIFEPAEAECGAHISDHPRLVRWLVAVVILLAAQGLAVDPAIVYSQATNLEQASTYLLVVGAVAFTSGVFSTFFAVRLVVLVPLAVVAVVAAAQVITGAPARSDLWVISFILGFLLALKIRLSNWHVQLWNQWEADLDLLAAVAASEERLSVARDIHDSTGQTLAAIAIKAEIAQTMFQKGDPRAITEAREVSRLARTAIKETRSLAIAFRRTDVRTELVEARTLLESVGATLRVTGSASAWPEPIRGAFGWAIREATTNITRHAPSATAVSVTLANTEGRATMTIHNDGVVLVDPTTGATAASAGGGSGIIGMRERLAEVGGTVTSQLEGSEYTLTVTAPFDPAQVDQEVVP